MPTPWLWRWVGKDSKYHATEIISRLPPMTRRGLHQHLHATTNKSNTVKSKRDIQAKDTIRRKYLDTHPFSLDGSSRPTPAPTPPPASPWSHFSSAGRPLAASIHQPHQIPPTPYDISTGNA